MADVVAIGLRALAIAAALSAAGAAIFHWLFGAALERSAPRIRALALATIIAALLLSAAHIIVEPVRLAGAWSGVLDRSLHALLLGSDFGVSTALRLFGLLVVLAGALRPGRIGDGVALIGAAVIAVSFAFMGHTAADAERWLLAPLLITHLLAIAFWLGSLGPLAVVARREDCRVAGAVLARFSRIAVCVVPGILVAGVSIAGLLLPGLSALRTPYGYSLTTKVAGFAVLMGIAAINKWRLAPRIAQGDATAVRALQWSMVAEWAILLAVITVTVVMTSLFAVGH